MKPITSLAEKSNPSRYWQRNQTHHVIGREIKPQYCLYRAKAKQTPANQTQRCLSKKKKSPIHKPKPNPSKPNPVTHGYVAAARSLSSSSLAPHRRSQILDRRLEIADRRSLCPCSGARCLVLPSALPQGIFLFFSLTLS